MFTALTGERAPRALLLLLGAGGLLALAACAPIKPPPPPGGTPTPTISGLAPDCGPEAGGNFITIFGTGFNNAEAVFFGLDESPDATVDSDNQITAEAPPGTGIVDVTVLTTSDFTDDTAADDYLYSPTPAVTGLTPDFGPGTGGNTVNISGTGLACVDNIMFGSNAATSLTVIDDTEVTAVTPAGAGTVDVIVSGPAGTSTNTAVDDYTYTPVVTGINPMGGPIAGTTAVTITGASLGSTGTTTVTFGGTSATGVVVNGAATQITATAPAHSAGTFDVVVTTPDGTNPNTAADNYTYAPVPTVSGLEPSAGSMAGGNLVTIFGTGFKVGTVDVVTGVTFGGTAASCTDNFATEITCTAPAGTGTVDVIVTTFGGPSPNTAVDDYIYAPVPTVTALNPAGGPVGGGNSVVITGTGFKVGAVDVTLGVTFGPNETGGNCTADLATQITCTNVPAGTGTVSVRVTTAGGTTADTAADDYIYAPVPTITALSVAGGPEAGGNAVTISGTGFKVGTVDVVTGVTFGGTAATCTTNSATEVACTAPAGTGLVDVFVTTFGGTGDALDSYAYAPTPTVTGLSPASGSSAGGTPVTVTGTGFKVASVDVVTGVTFGGTTAVCTTATATTLNCTSPAHAATLATVTVTTFGGSSPDNTPFDSFLYTP